MKLKLSTILFFFIVFSAACGNKKQDSASNVVATIDGTEITKAEFEAFLKFKRINADDAQKKKKVLEEYISRAALAKAIESEKLLDNALIEAELAEFKKEMLISRYFEKYLKENVTDKAVTNYYNTHAADYEEQKIKVAHLLIRVNDRMDETEKQAKVTLINEALTKLKSGEAFEDVVAAYSEDKISAKKGGDIGWIKKGGIDPNFSDAVFAMKKDEISQPIKTAFGYHLAKVLEDAKSVKSPLRAVEGDIRYQLREKAKKAETERLRTKTKVEVR